ncbi:MAG: hypothetical protein KDK70_27005, partial [Myxococcales bacterium]|nr:hypothetical protein [Myxococcales bacterium]
MDTRDINAQNLLFLLTAAPLSVGCIITSDDDVATTNPTTSTGTTSPTSGTDDSTTASTNNDTTADTSNDTTGPGDTTMTPADTTVGETTDSGTPECIAYGDAVADCYTAKDGVTALEYCEESVLNYADYSEDCAAAGVAFFACLSGLT